MNLQRLKFAYARGARIEFRSGATDTWHTIRGAGRYDYNEYRIHPDDAHLEYGPFSTALLEVALNYIERSASACMQNAAEVASDDWYADDDNLDDVLEHSCSQTRRWFEVLVAEAMCDEGL